MDTLTVIGLQNVQDLIQAVEARWPSIGEENARIRLASPALKTMGFSDDEISAALVSSCRSDMLNCGRCALGLKFLRLTGKTLPAYLISAGLLERPMQPRIVDARS